METNFSFLESKKEYELFAGACIDAECIFCLLYTSPWRVRQTRTAQVPSSSLCIRIQPIWMVSMLLLEK